MYIKTALEIATNETTKYRKAKKKQALAQKAKKWMDSSSANCLEDNPSKKMAQENSVKKSNSQERKESSTYEKAVIISSKRRRRKKGKK